MGREFHQLSNDVLFEFFLFNRDELQPETISWVSVLYKKIEPFLWIWDPILQIDEDMYISLEREHRELSNGVCYKFL